jgi:hypothetical protein
MSGDYSRDTFDALKDFAGVYLQQGRALLDADFNELGAILERRIRAGTVDTIGRCVVPRETEDGFAISVNGDDLGIGTGRIYVHGTLVENHGPADFTGERPDLPPPVFARGALDDDGRALGVLDEMVAGRDVDPLSYRDQPYWPTPEDLPDQGGAYLAYLVTWQREVTPVKDPALLEPAMGGIDTCTRWQTVWQVRMLADVGDNATCATPDDLLAGWDAVRAPSTARLTTATVQVDAPEDPCLVPPTDGYTGVENQLYRVELHATEPGAPPTSFKFSRENASVAARVDSIGAGNDRVTVTRIGRDAVLRFSPGDWVELTDNHRELNHRSGQMLRIDTVNPETREIVFRPGSVIDAALVPGVGDTLDARATRLIRWDQNTIIRRADDLSEWTNVDADASDGLIPIPPDGVALLLESGITVAFSTADGPGGFRDMDHWLFAARTAGTQIEELRAAPPRGIQRHYCKLAVVRLPDSVLDCRIFWPPEVEGGEGDDCCGCTVCVTAEGHNSGVLTIQAAIDQVDAAGGTICLDAGNYALRTPVTIRDRNAIRMVGQGIGTILTYQGTGAAIAVGDSFDILFERFTLFVAAESDSTINLPITHGIAAKNVGLLALNRLAILVSGRPSGDSFDFGIALDGLQIGTTIEDCLVFAPHAIGSRSSFDIDVDDLPDFIAAVELRVADCILFGGQDAVHFDLVALNAGQIAFERNAILARRTGMQVRFFELPAAATRIRASTITADGDAIRLGSQDGAVIDCQISAGAESGDGIRLLPSHIPDTRTDAQIIGNTILDLAGAGIRLTGAHDTVLIKRNVLRRCGFAGVAIDSGADVTHIAVDNNVIEDIADATGADFAGGVILTSAETAIIQGNGIRRVGRGGQDGGSFVGISGQDLRTIRIAGNVIDEIGPSRSEARAAAILVRQPYDDVIVSENQIGGALLTDTDSLGHWRAVEIGLVDVPPQGDNAPPLGPAVVGAVPSMPGADIASLAFLRLDEEVIRLGSESLHAVARSRLAQIGLSGNQIRARGAIRHALIQVFDAGVAALSVAQNQVSQIGGGGPRAAVHLGSQRIVLNGNSVLHQSDSISIELRTGRGAATPIGNITSNRIMLNGGAIPAPFDALNLID